MEDFITYKVPRKKGPPLMLPPPYCRKAEKKKNEEMADAIPPLKLEVSDPSKILVLCESLTDSSTRDLEAKVNKYLLKESQSDNVFFINMLKASQEAVIQTIGTRPLEAAIRVRLTTEVFKSLFKTDKGFPEPSELNSDLQSVLKEVIRDKQSRVTIVPILYRANECVCPSDTVSIPHLIVFVNSKREDYYLVKLVREGFRFFITIFKNTAASEEESRLKEQCQALLDVARKLFGNLADVNDLLREIMMEARRLTDAERCSLFLLDPDNVHLVAKVFDGVSSTEVKIAKDQGIAGHVATTGKSLNIKNAYEHPLFFKGMDEATGFRTRNILCFPIRDETGIVGVAQLCNKKHGDFDYSDEQVAMAFSILCGLSIVHSLVYKKIQDAQARSKLSNELMMYHMKVSLPDVIGVMCCPNPHNLRNFDKFSFNPRNVPYPETVCYVLKQLRDLGLTEKFKFKEENLVRFLLYVRRGYRDAKDAPYHNWMHAFSVSHFAYTIIKNGGLLQKGYITHFEALMYIIGSVCHDVDHRGTTNSFQTQTGSVLANLYSSEGSVMERHHLSQSLCILNTDGCNFLDVFDNEHYILCLDLLKDFILATDLANHLKLTPRQYAMAKMGYNKNSREHRYLLMSLLMTCADLSDQTKDWHNTRSIAVMIYSEFFKQGDLEKEMGKTPVEMMDRDRASIPDLQIQFLNTICLPVFTILAIILPPAKELFDHITDNLRHWEVSKPFFEKCRSEGNNNYMELLASKTLEMQVIAALKALDEEAESI